MQEAPVAGLRLFFDAGEREAAELIRTACEHSVQVIRQAWGLDVPADCRVYLMTSWREFMFDSAPGLWKAAMVITQPLWQARVEAMWPLAGGWEQRYGRRQAVGIKPPRLLQAGDSSLGDQVFIREADPERKVQSVTCHELTHAFSSHLRLPAWLKEGLAMVAVDHYWGRPTVRQESLAWLEHAPARQAPAAGPEALLPVYIRGYWLTRYLAETQPDLTKGLLEHQLRPDEIERRVAAGLGMEPEAFWRNIGPMLARYFRSPA